MNDCPICDHPVIWSDDRGRHWCSVYGDHRDRFHGPNVMLGSGPIAAVIELDLHRRKEAS